jgi:hypothetical protein
MKINHEEYVLKKRREAATIASGMLDGSIQYLEGAIQLSSLMFELEIEYDDKDFLAFDAVSSETHNLPLGSARQHWASDALASKEIEIKKAIVWAKEISLAECKSIVERFSS